MFEDAIHVRAAPPSRDELESLYYALSHDMRAPLRHLQGYLSLLLEQPAVAQDPEAREYAARAATAVAGLVRLTTDVLQLSRRGQMSVSCTPVCMTALVEQTQHDFLCDLSGREATWRVDPLPDALGDEALLRRIWQNLIENALKYTRNRPNAHIHIGGAETADECIYFVKDNGVGFDPARAERLFGMFERLHELREFDGYGIGLASVRDMVHRHGGRVWARGEEGQGAAFFFTLPRAAG